MFLDTAKFVKKAYSTDYTSARDVVSSRSSISSYGGPEGRALRRSPHDGPDAPFEGPDAPFEGPHAVRGSAHAIRESGVSSCAIRGSGCAVRGSGRAIRSIDSI